MILTPGKLYKIKKNRYYLEERFYYYNDEAYEPWDGCIISGEILLFLKINRIYFDSVNVKFLYQSKEVNAVFFIDPGTDMHNVASVFLEQVGV